MTKREEFVKNLKASTYVSKLLKTKRKVLLAEKNSLDKGTPEGYIRYNEINEEIELIRTALIQV
ncbi:hypothetical protein [Paenibacillus sp. MER 99-2]|uniref:hypothetical protein n=1 Tax=Paenibacillus sp. MER 99-2 TaxID=2939572 RepID=UPI00203CC874|nr:hypothetical protein [Paenibacillus sp. MER 99-2]MCM3176237.1 hypothetical protein [Paenibacillus sp. MER 99-2]